MYNISDIDVFILTHNRADIIEQTIESILNSTIKPDKVTVLDNDSTDNTEEIIKKYEKFNFKYVKTSGLHGNFYASQKLAEREFIIRLHDDNLIHPEYFEKMIFIINNFKNFSIANCAYTIFDSDAYENKDNPLLVSYYNPEPLLNNFLIADTKSKFIEYLLKSHSKKIPYNIGGTPFLISKTKNFKEYEHKFDKYGKADDVDYYLYSINKGGYFISLTDNNAAFFRQHQKRDSMNDENSLSMAQLKNWLSMFVNCIKDNKEKELWSCFFHICYATIPAFLKKDIQRQYDNEQLFNIFYNENLMPKFTFKYYEEFKQNKKIISDKDNSLFQKIFSVKNDYTTGRKVKKIYFLGMKFKIG